MIFRTTTASAALILSLGCATAQTPDLLSPKPFSGGARAPAQPPVLAPVPSAAPPAAAQTMPEPFYPVPGAAAPVPGAAAAQPAAPKPKKPAPVVVRETAITNDPTPTFEPLTFYTTAKAAERYAAIADSGGWPVVPAGVGPGSAGKAVAALRRRLQAEGDLPAGSDGEAWGPDLPAAIKRFQARMGLRQTGAMTPGTLRAMNIPAATRVRQLLSSAQRVAGTNFPFGERWVVVNIPSAAAEAIEGGQVVRRYTAVVGDITHRSPEVMTRIQAVNLNPTWTVPQSIIKNEIIPKMRKDPGYLSRAKIRILDGRGEEVNPRAVDWNTDRAVNYTLRQDSGAANALGNIRLNMPNQHAVYMHDTPSKKGFSGDYRFLSHGCVRVEGVFDLAAWTLEGTAGAPAGRWDSRALQAKVATNERIELKLAKPVPVIWVYMTGWASSDGTVHFRDDVYDVDKIGLSMRETAPDRAAGPLS